MYDPETETFKSGTGMSVIGTGILAIICGAVIGFAICERQHTHEMEREIRGGSTLSWGPVEPAGILRMNPDGSLSIVDAQGRELSREYRGGMEPRSPTEAGTHPMQQQPPTPTDVRVRKNLRDADRALDP